MRKVIAVTLGALWLAGGAASAQTGTPASGAQPFALDIEALLWWYKSSPTPVPVITDDVYGRPGTSVLLGGGDLDTNPNWGFRLTGTYAIDPRWGVEGGFFFVPERSTSRSVSSSGAPGSTDLLLPYFDVIINRESFTEISFAPVYAGRAMVELSNSLMGAEANAIYALDAARPWDVRLIGGFRWLRLRETYTITTSSPFIPPNPGGSVWDTTDKFQATNNFYGAQFGVRARYDDDRWFASGALKIALGAMDQAVDVTGSLVTNDFNDFGATETYAGGYFALPTNIGGHSRTEFAVLPEASLGVGYRLTPALSIFAAYTVIYASNVVRPGEQVNRNINPTQSVSWTSDPILNPQGPAQPTFSFNASSFWAQGVSVGLRMRF